MIETVTRMLSPYSGIPDSTLLILAVAATLSFITSAANRLLVDVKKMKKIMDEVNAWRMQLEKARKSNDKKLLAKVMKKQEAVMKLQSQAMWDRMKVSIIFLAPFWIIFMILSRFYASNPVALSPFSIPFLLSGATDPTYGARQLMFFSWYIICSFAVSLPLSRILGVNPED
ncbi:MAG: EMC3/TMCO1 family protein [Candidatus Bathyarchaeia archaeon]